MSDVDALTIAVSRLVGADLAAADGAVAIFIAAAVNTVVKAGIALIAGTCPLGLRVIAAYAAVRPACGWGADGPPGQGRCFQVGVFRAQNTPDPIDTRPPL